MPFRRRTFIKGFFWSITGIIGLVFLDGFWFEKYIIDWTVYDLHNSKQEPVKIIQLSDLHLREVKSFHKTIAKRINKEQPDAIVFTGDTISHQNKIPVLEEFLALLNVSLLKIVILGNKEYSGRVDLDEFGLLFKKYNGTVLVNENFVLQKNKRQLNLLGMDDFIGGKSDFAAATQGIDRSLETVVLNHCPEYRDTIDKINTTTKVNIKAILSGHTHGGQITFFGKELFKPGGSGRYLKGWYKNQQSKMYVSKGIGTTILPIRFCARAEASIFYF